MKLRVKNGKHMSYENNDHIEKRWSYLKTEMGVGKKLIQAKEKNICYYTFGTIKQKVSTFWFLHTPKSKLYPSGYPKSDLHTLGESPNKKLYPNKLLLSGF